MRSKFTPDSILQSIKGQVFSWKINQKELNSKLADLPSEKLEKLFILHDSDIVKQFSKCLHNCFFVLSKKEENKCSVFDNTIMKNGKILFILINPTNLQNMVENTSLKVFMKEILILLCSLQSESPEIKEELSKYMINDSIFESKKKIIIAKPENKETFFYSLSNLHFKGEHKILQKRDYNWFFKECRKEFLSNRASNEKPVDYFVRSLEFHLQVISYLISNNIMKYLSASNLLPINSQTSLVSENSLICEIRYENEINSSKLFAEFKDDIEEFPEDELILSAMKLFDSQNLFFHHFNGIPLLQTLQQGLIYEEMKGSFLYNQNLSIQRNLKNSSNHSNFNFYSYGNPKKTGRFRKCSEIYVPKAGVFGSVNGDNAITRKYSRISD